MKEYRLELKIRNNYLLTIMEERGITRVAEMSALSGVHPYTIYGYLNLRASPFHKKTGVYKDSVVKIAKALDYDPEFLFPENFLTESNKIIVEVSTKELEGLHLEGERNSIGLPEEIDYALSLLTPKQSNVLRKAFGIGEKKKNLKAIGEEIGLSGTMVGVILKDSLKRLKHPVVKRRLEQFQESR